MEKWPVSNSEIEERRETVSEKDQLAGLLQSISERRRSPEEPVHEILEEFETKGLIPKRAVLEISRRLEKYEKAGASKEVLRLQAKDVIKDSVTMYRDERFEISNFNFFKAELFGFIDKILVEDELESLDDLDKTAMIFFDVDGLKAVNDNALNLHAAGDVYLKKISQTFNEGRTTKWLESLGVEVSPARRSGDEFMYALRANSPLTKKADFVGIDGEKVENTSFADYVIARIKEDVHDIDMADVQDFSDPKQREKYKNISETWPEDFKFRASISGGAASLLDAIRILNERKGDIDGKMYEELVAGELIGGMIDLSDKLMLEDKRLNKQKRRESNNREDVLLEAIYRSARESEDEKN